MTLSNAITALRPLCPVVDDASKKDLKDILLPSFLRAYSFVVPCAFTYQFHTITITRNDKMNRHRG